MAGSGKPKIKTVNIFLGFFFVVNFCLGTGFLGIPYAFFYSGYLAAIPTLLLISAISWINANYLLEVMARAQALEYFEKAQRPSGLDSSSEDDANSLLVNMHTRKHPTFEITIRRKFEVVELCEIFFNKWVKYLYLVILNIYCFLASWSFATVAGSSWAINIPYNFSRVEICVGDPFHHSVLPVVDTCRNAYYFSLFLYAVVVVSLSLVDLREQAIIQMVLGLMRFLTVGAIIVYALARIAAAGGEDECLSSSTNESNDTSGSGFPWEIRNGTRYSSYGSVFINFDAVNWLTAIPIFTYAFILHQGIASLTHPIKQKRYMGHLITAMFSTALLCYMTLGVIAPLWFKYGIQETVTLNFSKYTSADHSLALRILAYYLLLFPSLDVVSAYPLMVHTVVNNLYIIITGRDTSAKIPSKRKLDFILRLVLRLIVGILPILAALGVANLVYVLKYAGLMGFNICFFFPTVLQWRSMSVCKRKFAPSHISVSGSHTKDEEQKSLLPASSATSAIIFTAGQHSLLSTKQLVAGKKDKSQYMTPYSSVVFSHPIAVILVGVVGGCLFILTVASLGVHPSKLSCDLPPA